MHCCVPTASALSLHAPFLSASHACSSRRAPLLAVALNAHSSPSLHARDDAAPNSGGAQRGASSAAQLAADFAECLDASASTSASTSASASASARESAEGGEEGVEGGARTDCDSVMPWLATEQEEDDVAVLILQV